MKKIFASTCLVAMLFTVAVLPMAYAAADQDNPLDGVGDWFATLGKQGIEKDQIIAERKTKRTVERARKQAEKEAKKAQKVAEKMKKNLGF